MTDKKEITYKTLRWGPCVVHYQVPEKFREHLLEEANKSNTSYGSRLAGHLKKEVKVDSTNCTQYFDEMFSIYNHALNNWTSRQDNIRYILSDLWCNFQKANEFNPPHNHGGTLSFVVYLKVPKEIKEECLEHQKTKSSAGPGSISFMCGDTDKKLSVTQNSFFPEVGDCFIFPAFLEHWVYPYRSDVTRISVSGNIVDNLGLKYMSDKGVGAAIKDIERKNGKIN